MSQEIIWFLKTEFQQAIEKSEYLFKKPAPEETPYNFKYEARKILEDLLKNENFAEISENSEIQENISDEERNSEDFINKQYLIACKMIINFHLGANFQETDEGHLAEPYYQKSLKLIAQLDYTYVYKYYNYLQGIYNIMGLIYLNKDENLIGMQFLGKADDLYKSIIESNLPQITLVNNSQEFLNNEIQQFSYMYEGGLCSKKTESLYTHTLFFLAQGYTKMDQKELAADYCGRTMKRQYESNTHEIKDFCVNCMSLAEFYGNIKNFKQAEYLILAALSLLPEGRKKKMRATLQMSLGFLLHQYMEVSVKIINEDRLNDTEENEKMYNNMKLTFEGIENNCKNVTVKKDIEEVKSIFRQANTQFKKALEYFVLDGFVTEHIQIVNHQSELYQFLQILEKNPKSIIGLSERRLGLLEPIFKVINPKSYQDKYQKLLVDIAETYNLMFELQYSELFGNNATQLPKAKQLQKMNLYGMQVINFYTQIHQILLEDKDTERNAAYYNSIITAKFNIAKAYSKMYVEGRKNRVESLVNSLNAYKWIEDYIKKQVPEEIKVNNHEFDQQQNMCVEMINLLPAKIDKANSERWENE